MPLKLDLTQDKIRPLSITDETSGETIRFTFKRILNRQERAMMQKRVGKGAQNREVPDLARMFRTCVATIEGLDLGEGEAVVSDPELIVKILVTPENRGGLPEEMVEQVVRYIMGEIVLGEERGNV